MKTLVLFTCLLCALNIAGPVPEGYSTEGNYHKEYHLEDPFKFIIREFDNHDVIFLGESHLVKENLLFLQDLIPLLHKNGINTLFYEFANYEDSTRIDILLNSDHYDETLAREVILAAYDDWDYREYADVFRSAWQINRKCRTHEPHFRIIGLNSSKSTEFKQNRWIEEDWANCVYQRTKQYHEKALVYCGAQHALTKYQVPRAVNGTFAGLNGNNRIGQCLYRMIGEKCMTIWLHHRWPDKNGEYQLLPCQGTLDSIIRSLPQKKQRFAFSTTNSPLGLLKDTISLYSLGYNTIRLQQIVDGYIVLKPAVQLTVIKSGSGK